MLASRPPSTKGHTYDFCSASCHGEFVKEPEKYLEATDPICGMKVDRASAKHFARHEGAGLLFLLGRLPG
jgi:P-type Cu+ transporter